MCLNLSNVYEGAIMSSSTNLLPSMWNPIIGCDKYSKGCQNCYAQAIALRLQKQGIKDYQEGFKIKNLPHRLNIPYTWQKPRKVFVNSMSDLFHKDVPLDYLKQIFTVMNNCPQHLFQIITKRAENMLEISPHLKWTDNIMVGATIEHNDYRHRLDILKAMPAKYKFLCIEPLIGRLEKLDLRGIDWIVVGGESGPKARPMDISWVKDIKLWCDEYKVPFWFKQTREYGKTKEPPLLDGKLYQAEPNIKLQKTLLDFL